MHLTAGLAQLQQLPDNPERAQQELALQVPLGAMLRATQAYGSAEVERAYLRACELCQQLGEPRQLSPVLYSLYELYEYRGAFERSLELEEQLLHVASLHHDPVLLLGAHDALACTAFHLGTFAHVLEHAGQGLSFYDPQQHRTLTSLYGKNLSVTCWYWSAMALWFLGYPEQARRRINESQTLAHPYSMAAALNRGAFIGQFCQESRATREWAETAVGIATEHGFPRHAALGTILRGWALVRQGQRHEGMAQIHQGFAAYRELGMAMEDPYFLALLADAYASSGEIAPGLAALADALARLPRGRGFFYEAELHRLRGELLLRQATPDALQVEECFHQALAIARHQEAKSLELRAAMSLCRLWQQHGKSGEARQLLAEVYTWFTEGFDTVDLREARALLTALTD